MKGNEILISFLLGLIIMVIPFSGYTYWRSSQLSLYSRLVKLSGLFTSEKDISIATNELYSGLMESSPIDFHSQNAKMLPEEKIHMEDVADLLRINRTGFFILLIFFFSSLFVFHLLKKWRYVFNASIVAMVLLIGLVSIGYFWFDGLFTLFHLLLFRNRFWLVSVDSTLLKLFPTEFFFQQFLWIISLSFCWFILLLFISRKMTEREQK